MSEKLNEALTTAVLEIDSAADAATFDAGIALVCLEKAIAALTTARLLIKGARDAVK